MGKKNHSRDFFLPFFHFFYDPPIFPPFGIERAIEK